MEKLESRVSVNGMKQESASNKLLSTKLYIPLAREIVSRPRLVELLKEGFRRKLTLVSTPPGFGKTTLLSEWIDREKVAAAWVSLDDGDNDITRFLTYFITALQTIESSIGESVRVMLASSRSLRFEAVLTALINEISDIPEHFSLVLDDYHVIKAQSIHSALTFLLDHLPPQMHLVVATRADPPFHLARLRGRRQLTELRASSLRFTPEEVQEFLNRVMGLGLSEDESAALDSHTEGWITGLQMAAISMQGRDTGSMTDFIQAFTGSNRFVLDYLVEEVINRQTENFKSFLLQTAILDHLTGPLCDVVTGQSEGQSILERMDRANLFLVPLDTERSWYRYHRLFADLLQKRLKQVYPDRISSLHIRASGWYEQNGFMDEAIDHTIFAEDFERAANLIEQAAEPTLMRGETDTLLGWVDSLPDDMVCAKPLLCVYHAGAMLLNGQPLAAIESRLGDASQGDRTAAVPGEIAVLRALIAAIQGDTRQGSELSHKALELLPEDRVFLKGFVAVIFGLICILNGEIKAAIRHFTEVAKIGKKTGNFMAAIMADRRLASLYMLLGRLGEAEDICKKALDRYVDDQGHLLPLAGMVLTRLGELERERNDLEKAQQHLVEGIELSKQWVDIGSFDGYISLARVRQALGDMEGASEAIRTAQEVAAAYDATEIDDIVVAAFQARLWIAQGNLEAAKRWAEERELSAQSNEVSSSYYIHEFEHITLARLQIAEGRNNEAQAILKDLLKKAEKLEIVGSVIEILILQTVTSQAQGNTSEAITSLERALSLAESGGYIRIFIDEGQPMAKLLYKAASRGIMPSYTGKLLAAFSPSRQAYKKAAGEIVETLSSREVEVLQLIAEGLSNKEIADKIYLSLRTVKWHATNIYAKLGVKNRTQAVAKARALGILPAFER